MLRRIGERKALCLLSRRLYSPQPNRALATESSKPAEDAPAARNLPPVGFTKYSNEDPIWWNFTWDYKGDGKPYMYREFRTEKDWGPSRTFWVKAASGFFWFWLFYNTYWNYEMITREYAFPDLTTYTDAELGIPPDNADDPEYWGQHAKYQGVMQHR